MHGPRTADLFGVRILTPHFTAHVCNCLSEADLDYLRTQLTRHHFDRYELPGQEMHDEHGFFLTLRKRLSLGDVLPAQWNGLAARMLTALLARPARRAAILLTAADVVIARDFSRLMAFMKEIGDVAEAARSAQPSVQVCVFLTSHDPGFPAVDPVAQRRAASHPGLKVMQADVAPSPWSQPRDSTLGPMHQFTVSPAAWHYLSCGHMSRAADERWHAYEQDDSLTFILATGGWPCLEGVFAKTRDGMTLVGIRHESDPARFQIPASGEDPFTLFRGLCQQLVAWQASLSPPPH